MNPTGRGRAPLVDDLTGFEGRDRFGLLVLLLVALLIVSGVSDDPWVRLVTALLNLAALLLVVGRPRNRRQRLLVVALVTVGSLGGLLVTTERVDGVRGAVGSSAQALVLFGAMLVVFVRLSRHERVTSQTLLGGIAAYFLLGFAFAWIYLALPSYLDEAVLRPAQGGEIPIYYSFVVLTTLGFGDIHPVGAVAQRITVLEALMGQLFLAILISRLVSVWTRGDRSLFSRQGSDTDSTS